MPLSLFLISSIRLPSLLILMLETEERMDCFLLFSEGSRSHWLPTTLMLSFLRYFCSATAFSRSRSVLLALSFLLLRATSALELPASCSSSDSSRGLRALGTTLDCT